MIKVIKIKYTKNKNNNHAPYIYMFQLFINDELALRNSFKNLVDLKEYKENCIKLLRTVFNITDILSVKVDSITLNKILSNDNLLGIYKTILIKYKTKTF